MLKISIRVHLDEAEVEQGQVVEEGGEMLLSFWVKSEERLWFALEAGRPVRSAGTRMGLRKIRTASADEDDLTMTATTALDGGFERSWSYVD